MPRQEIDGERKYRVVKRKGLATIVGFHRKAEWSAMNSAELYTQREIHGITLHCEDLQGQLPQVGYTFPAKLLRSKGRTGAAMSAKLEASANQRRLERSALKTINQLHKLINL